MLEVTVEDRGATIVWPKLDIDFSVAEMLPEYLGIVTLRASARRAGKATSQAKTLAARVNGAKDGRPRKIAPELYVSEPVTGPHALQARARHLLEVIRKRAVPLQSFEDVAVEMNDAGGPAITKPNDVQPRANVNPLSRGVGVVAAVILLLFYVPTAWGGFSAHGTLGCAFGAHDEIVGVERGGPAARAGLQVGDVLRPSAHDWARGFAAVAGDLAPGVALDLGVNRGGRERTVHIVSVVADATSLSDALFQLGAFLATATALIVAGGMCALRPGAMSWWFLLYAAGTISANQVIYAYGFLPAGIRDALVGVVLALIASTAAFPILPFVLRFPYDTVTGRRRYFYRASVAATIATAVGFSAYYLMLLVNGGIAGSPLYAESTYFATVAGNIPIPLAIVVLVWTYLQADLEGRERLKWGILGMSFAVIAFAASSVAFLNNTVVSNALQLLTVMLPLSLAYALKRHRLIDLSFIANRTIGYGATTLVVLLIVQVADEMARWALHEIALAPVVSLGISLVTGIFIARFHKLLGTLVERVLFRKRLAADKRLRLVAGAMLYATSERAVDDMLAADAAETLGLASAAVFHLESARGVYTRAAAVGWGDGHARSIPRDDLLALMLGSKRQLLRLEDVRWNRTDVPTGAQTPVLALPLDFRREIRGFVVFGAHTNGTSIDPDEVKLLELLAINAGTAYGLVEGNEASLRLAELESQGGSCNYTGVESGLPFSTT